MRDFIENYKNSQKKISILISVPSQPPNAVLTTSTSGFTVIMEWQHISPDQWNGKPVGTQIFYNSSQSHSGNVTVPYPASSFVISGLNPVTTYKFMVCEMTRPGNGPCQQTKATTLFSSKYLSFLFYLIAFLILILRFHKAETTSNETLDSFTTMSQLSRQQEQQQQQ